MKKSKILKKISSIVPQEYKLKTLIILCYLFLSMFLEAMGLGMLLPIVNIILDPEIINNYPLIIDFLSDYGINSHNQIVSFTMISFAVVYVIKTIFLIIIAWFVADYSQGLSANISNKIFNYYISQPYIESVNSNTAHLQRNVTNEVQIFTGFVNNTLYLITELAIAVSIVITLIIIEPKGAMLIMVLLIFFSILIYYSMKNYIFKLGNDRLIFDKKRFFTLVESLNGYKEVKLFNKEAFFTKKFSERNFSYYSVMKKIQVIGQLPRLLFEVIAIICFVFFIIFSVYSGKDLTNLIAVLSVFLLAAFRLLPSFNRILVNIQAIKYGSVSIDFLYDELNKTNITNTKSLIKFDLKKPIIVNNVFFKYPNTKNYVLENINVEIPFGSFIGIIGESGSGKSTFIDNLLGFLSPSSGKITVDNIDIHKHPSSWMQYIGYVPQTIFLSDTSLRNNIAFGIENNDIDDDKIFNALKGAELLDFIESLSDGINTIVGEKGAKISGGQRQRIGIARALYYNPDILIFDEGTSSLDTKTENNIINSVLKFKNNKTIIMIAHRHTTLIKCERILDFNNASLTIKENV